MSDIDPTVLAQLRAPFPAAAIGKLPRITCGLCAKRNCDKHKARTCSVCKGYLTSQHIHLDYVGHAHVRERLNEVDPGWNWRPCGFDPNGLPLIVDGMLWIELTVGGKTMLGVGDAVGKQGGPAVKEMIGDALRNAAMSFGVALDLWKKHPVDGPPADGGATPAEQPPAAPVQTERERANQLRGLIRDKELKKGRSVTDVAADFAQWSQGGDITKAGVAVLTEYKAHLDRPADDGGQR